MILIVMGLWMLYNFFTIVFPALPYISLYRGGNAFIQSFSVLAVKWSLPMAFVFITSGVLLLLEKDTKPKLFLVFFGLIISLLLLL